MTVDARARAGLFLAMQYPVEVPGVSVSNFLRTAVTATRGEAPKLRNFVKELNGAMSGLAIDPKFAERSLNEGFSGGEKKRHEILQLELLDPKIAVLDETDSGLDVDALKVVSEGINRFRAKPGRGVLLITHYTRILRYISPTSCTSSSAAGSSKRAAPSWPTCWRTRATSGSRERAHRHERASERRRGPSPSTVPFDVEAIRKDFPILSRTVRNGKPLVYLDSGATSQHPTVVLDAEREYYERHNAAAHRGTHLLGQEATEIYEGARAKVAAFLGAATPDEVVFTKSATEGINLVAFGLAWSLRPGDEIVISEIEHHANLVPWQQLALRTGATLKWFRELPDGRLDVDPSLVTERTKVVAVTGQSNVTGVIPPLREIGELAHSVGALFLVDGAQLVPHHPVDVAAIGADFLAFSGHKMLGPLGLGVLYGKYAALDALPPFLTGGSMIEVVRMEETTFLPPPAKFEPRRPRGLAGRRPRRGDGLPDRARHGQRGRARGGADRARARGPRRDRRRAHPRPADHGEPRRHGRVRGRGRARARRRPGARRARHRDQDRPPLRVAAAPHARLPGVQPGVSFYLYNTHAEVDALADGIRYAKKFFRA